MRYLFFYSFLCCLFLNLSAFSQTLINPQIRIDPETVRNFRNLPDNVVSVAEPEIYLEAKFFAEDLLQKYPEKNHYFLSVGRSLSMVVEIMKLNGIQSVSEIPFTGGAHFDFNVKNEALLNILERHFDAFFPKQKLLENKSLVLIDFFDTGDGMLKFLDVVSWYFNKKKFNVNLKIAALIVKDLPHLKVQLNQRIETLNINNVEKINIEFDTIRAYREDVDSRFIATRKFANFGNYTLKKQGKYYTRYLQGFSVYEYLDQYIESVTGKKCVDLFLNPEYEMKKAMKVYVKKDPNAFIKSE